MKKRTEKEYLYVCKAWFNKCMDARKERDMYKDLLNVKIKEVNDLWTIILKDGKDS